MKCVKVIKHATVTLSQCTASTCQRMRLLSIDHGVWKDILLNWLGSLRQIVRLNFAVGVSADFRKVFAQLAFPLPATVSPDLLVGLCSWMKLRDVYLNRIEVKRNFIEWNAILSWCRNRLLHLHILGNVSRREWPIKAHFLQAVSIHCRNLHELKLTHASYHNGEYLGMILGNNAFTLVVLIVERIYNTLRLDDISCPRLQILSWDVEDCTGLGAFLSRCPILSSLSLHDNFYKHEPALLKVAAALAESCTMLTRLRIYGSEQFKNDSLRIMVCSCRHLEYLELNDTAEFLDDIIVDILQALPHLHTLCLDYWIDKSVWLEIAARGLAPNLRILAGNNRFTCTGFREFTAVYPHLTGLKVQITAIDINRDNKALFEHCRELKHLVLAVRRPTVEMVDALLESVALCCPGLEILELKFETNRNAWALQLVLDRCDCLKHVVINRWDVALNIPLGVTISDKGPPLAQWLPGVVCS